MSHAASFAQLMGSWLTRIDRNGSMNKYVFPGADASCALNWVIAKVSPPA